MMLEREKSRLRTHVNEIIYQGKPSSRGQLHITTGASKSGTGAILYKLESRPPRSNIDSNYHLDVI